MAPRRKDNWKPREILLGSLIVLLLFIIAGDIMAPIFTSIEHFKMLDEMIGATAAGILIIISNYFKGNETNNS